MIDPCPHGNHSASNHSAKSESSTQLHTDRNDCSKISTTENEEAAEMISMTRAAAEVKSSQL